MAEKVKYTLNMINIFNRAYADKPMRVRDKLRPMATNPEFKRTYGMAVIDKIQDRTLDGIDKNNRGFAPYSTSYKNSLPFRIYGKSSHVNLKLTGSMLASMNPVIKAKPEITIVIDNREDNDKAHGHINGTRSSKGRRMLPRRDFFGLPKEEESNLMRDMLNEYSKSLLVEMATEDLLKEGIIFKAINEPITKKIEFKYTDLEGIEDEF